MKVSTAWLKDFVGFKPPLERLAERLTLAGLEVKALHGLDAPRDTVFEIEITSNRPDWLSHLGVAREVAAVENLPIKMPEADRTDSRQIPPGWKVEVKEPEGCPYYSAVLIEGIEPAETPDFMKERLAACGLRSINLIVDMTNYVLLETGQPLHAFDADLLQGKQIQVRRAKRGESFTAINGSVYDLTEKDLVIADADRAVALAGIMGGKDSEVSGKTRSVLLESAYFHAGWIRNSSKRYGLSTDSSYRFERKVDPAGVEYARQRALFLIRCYAKPRFVSTVLKKGSLPYRQAAKIHLSGSEIKRILGAEVKPSIVSSILSRLGLEVKPRGQEAWDVGIPSFRSDLSEPVDLIEEIARIYGYDEIPATLPLVAPIPAEPAPLQEAERKSRFFLSGCGLYETVTFSLISERGLPELCLSESPFLVNPMNKELRRLRTTLIPSLLNVVQKNYAVGAGKIALFEIANLYKTSAREKRNEEIKALGIALSGFYKEKSWMDPEREASFFDLKGVVEALLDHLGISPVTFEEGKYPLLSGDNTRRILKDGNIIGVIGEVGPDILKGWDIEKNVYAAELFLAEAVKFAGGVRRFQELPRFPPVRRDLAVVVEEHVHAGDIIAAIEAMKRPLVHGIEIFDVYRGGRVPKGYKNLAFRLTYQSEEKTLVSAEVQALHEEIAAQVVSRFQATFQS